MPAAAASAAMACTMCSVCSVTLAGSWLRASPATAQRSATTLGAVPPRRTPMFAVVSSSSRPRRIAATARAAATTALRPSSGAMPACAAVPRNSASMRFWVGDATISVPGAPSLSSTNTRRAVRAARSSALAPRSPSSSPAREHELDVPGRRLGDEPAREHEQDGDRRLVVGAQHRLAVAAHEAVGDDDPRRTLDGDRVQVGAEPTGGASSASGDPGDEVAAAAAGDRSAAVLVDAETEVAEIALDDVGDLPLGARRRRDADEPDEEVEQLVV